MSRSPLMRIESLLRRLVEEPFTSSASEEIDPYYLAGYVLREIIDDDEREDVEEIWVSVNSAQFPQDEADLIALQESVVNYMELLAARTGQPLPIRPKLSIFRDDIAASQGPRVSMTTVLAAETPPSTALFARSDRDDIGKTILAADAFLIVQGRQHFPLQRPVVRIGRRIDNDIVLDSSAVSRYHAQLQWRDDGYVLFDTSGHDRTWVNGVPVQEQRLESGDVIGLSDVLLVYGEGRDVSESLIDDIDAPGSDTLLGP